MTFPEFKVVLRSFEESEKSQESAAVADNVMKMKIEDSKPKVRCFSCKQPGHKSFECPKKLKYRKPKTDKAKSANDQQSFAFKASVGDHVASARSKDWDKNTLLVDCGATAHIISDENKFVSRSHIHFA